MLQPRRFNPAALLIVLPLLAVAIIVSQKHLRQASPPSKGPTQTVSSESPNPSGLPHTSDPFPLSAAQKNVLKLALTKPKMMPMSIVAIGASIANVNTTYALANRFDINGFEYYQDQNAARFCQWSTRSSCWCLRSSLIIDSITAMPSAEYYSNGKQIYAKGPAGTYGLGGMGIVRAGTKCPTVKVVSTAFHSDRR